MKIIIRNRNKKIEVNNITSKEEMVWIAPEEYTQITTDAGDMAMEFMKKHPQIHEVKFAVLPQMDDDEDEEQFSASDTEVQKPRVIIVNEDHLQEDVDYWSLQYPDDHLTMEQVREDLAADDEATEGMTFGFPVSTQDPDRCYSFTCICLTPDVSVFDYQGLSKC